MKGSYFGLACKVKKHFRCLLICIFFFLPYFGRLIGRPLNHVGITIQGLFLTARLQPKTRSSQDELDFSTEVT